MELQIIDLNFDICKIRDTSGLDFSGEFIFLSKTDDEISLVCESGHVPPGVIASESGWKALRISGILDFAMTGVIAKISGLLAEAGIGIFVISTYNTDYILMKSSNFDAGVRVLTGNGYTIK